MKVLRQIKGVSLLDRMKNVDNRERLRQKGVLDAVNTRHERWKIRLQEMCSELLTKKLLLESWSQFIVICN